MVPPLSTRLFQYRFMTSSSVPSSERFMLPGEEASSTWLAVSETMRVNVGVVN